MNDPTREQGTDAHIVEEDQVRSVINGLASDVMSLCGIALTDECGDPFNDPLCPECKSEAGWLTDRRHEFGVINIETGVVTGARDGAA
jgi:hypothetical protein